MKSFLISDNHDTQVLLRLGGIPGVVAHGREECLKALSFALAIEDLGLLVVTELVAACIPDEVNRVRESVTLPLLAEIPDRHGTRRGKDFLTRYIHEVIGVKVS
ncbi:MAG: ATP synthase subunit F [Fretibacterium sp.]|nr:ATP synthase subunit F [Fretibacterium sp.]